MNIPSKEEAKEAASIASEQYRRLRPELNNAYLARREALKHLVENGYQWVEHVVPYRSNSSNGPIEGPASIIRSAFNSVDADLDDDEEEEEGSESEHFFHPPIPHPTVIVERIATELDEIPCANALSIATGYEAQAFLDAVRALRNEGWEIDKPGRNKNYKVISRPKRSKPGANIVDLDTLDPERRQQVLALLNGQEE